MEELWSHPVRLCLFPSLVVLVSSRILTQCVPAIFAVIFGVIFYSNYRTRLALHRRSPMVVKAPVPKAVVLEYSSLMLSTLTFTYFMVCRSALTVFNCTPFKGTTRYVLVADPTEYCYEPGTWQQVSSTPYLAPSLLRIAVVCSGVAAPRLLLVDRLLPTLAGSLFFWRLAHSSDWYLRRTLALPCTCSGFPSCWRASCASTDGRSWQTWYDDRECRVHGWVEAS